MANDPSMSPTTPAGRAASPELKAMVKDILIPADEAFTVAMAVAGAAYDACLEARKLITDSIKFEPVAARLRISDLRRAVPPGIARLGEHGRALDGLDLATVHRRAFDITDN